MLIKCPECGHQVSDQAKTCPSCGIEIAGKVTQCPDCGEIIFKEQSHCPNCHRSINGASDLPLSPRAAAASAVLKEMEQPAEQQKEPAARRPRKHHAAITALIVAFVIALIVVFLGIYFMKNQEQQNEMRAYENAMQSSEPLVLQNFLDMYADAPISHRDSIRVHLEALRKIDTDWVDAIVTNSRQAYERFLRLHPQSVHTVEAGIKIDSLDWMTATGENTLEAVQAYLTAHPDGSYYDEAKLLVEKLEAQQLNDDDRQMVIQLFTKYFNALSHNDDALLQTTIAPVITSFLHRSNATIDDVRQYMVKLHNDETARISFSPKGDWNIDKVPAGEGRFSFNVNFTVSQTRETMEGTGTTANYKVTAQVSPEGLISELNMKQSVQSAASAATE